MRGSLLCLWLVRLGLAVLLFQTITARLNIDRLPMSSTMKLPLVIFWWQEILFILFLFIGVKVLTSPEEIDPNEVVLLFLKIAADFARNMNWVFYFIAVTTWAYYCHWVIPDPIILGCLVLAFILILSGEKLWTPLNIFMAYAQLYISLLAGNGFGVVVGVTMMFNYARPGGMGGGQVNFAEWISGTSIRNAGIFFWGYVVLIFAMNCFLEILQDQSAVFVKAYSPFSIDLSKLTFHRIDMVF